MPNSVRSKGETLFHGKGGTKVTFEQMANQNDSKLADIYVKALDDETLMARLKKIAEYCQDEQRILDINDVMQAMENRKFTSITPKQAEQLSELLQALKRTTLDFYPGLEYRNNGTAAGVGKNLHLSKRKNFLLN